MLHAACWERLFRGCWRLLQCCTPILEEQMNLNIRRTFCFGSWWHPERPDCPQAPVQRLQENNSWMRKSAEENCIIYCSPFFHCKGLALILLCRTSASNWHLHIRLFFPFLWCFFFFLQKTPYTQTNRNYFLPWSKNQPFMWTFLAPFCFSSLVCPRMFSFLK